MADEAGLCMVTLSLHDGVCVCVCACVCVWCVCVVNAYYVTTDEQDKPSVLTVTD